MPGGGGGGHSGGFSGGHSGGFSGGHSGGFSGGHSGGFSGGGHSSGGFTGGSHSSGGGYRPSHPPYGGGGYRNYGGGYRRNYGYGGGGGSFYRGTGGQGCGCGMGAVIGAGAILLLIVCGIISSLRNSSTTHFDINDYTETVYYTAEIRNYKGNYLTVSDAPVFTDDECAKIDSVLGSFYRIGNSRTTLYVTKDGDYTPTVNDGETAIILLASSDDRISFSVYPENAELTDSVKGLLGGTYRSHEGLFNAIVTAFTPTREGAENDGFEGEYILSELPDTFTDEEYERMENAAKAYADKTGVSPFIHFTDDGTICDDSYNRLYDAYVARFTDEMHIYYYYIVTDDGSYYYYIEGDDIYNSIDKDDVSGINSVMEDTYNSPEEFVNAVVGVLNDLTND